MKILKLALRSIFHFRLYSAINVLGLALSLACVVIIARYVYGEMTVDTFHSGIDRIYTTISEQTDEPGQISISGVYNPNKEGTFVDIRANPGVELYTSFIQDDEGEVGYGDARYNAVSLAVDSNFFKIMDFPLVAGVADMSVPANALLTEEFAGRIFGDEDPMGKTLDYNGKSVTVAGIIGKAAAKSSLLFDIILSEHLFDNWGYVPSTLVLLYPGQDYREINRQHDIFYEMRAWNYSIRDQLLPLKEVYLSEYPSYVFQQGNRSHVYLLTGVGLLLLLMGSINYMNIYSSVMLRRGREFGMKKVFGAVGGKLYLQMLAENFALVLFALVAALSLVELFSPLVKNYLGFDQVPFTLFDFALAGILLVAIPVVVSLAPYLRYSYSAPITSLRGVGMTGGRGISRRLILVLQYVITVFMIVVSLFFVKQLRFMLDADPGFRTANVIHSIFLSRENSYDNIGSLVDKYLEAEKMADEIKQKMDASPLFDSWCYGDIPLDPGDSGFRFTYNDIEGNPGIFGADEKWMKLFELELLDGRLFNDTLDTFYQYKLVVSESVLKMYGITDFRQARLQPGRRVWHASGHDSKVNPPYEIIGVVKDVIGSHLGSNANPLVFYYNDGSFLAPMLASIVPGRRQEAIEFLSELHRETVGGEFTYSFIEDDLAALYKEDKKVAAIYSIFTLIAILISALGLFSMSLFDVQQRYNEIAIRKVNGAETSTIVAMLLRKYLVPSARHS